MKKSRVFRLKSLYAIAKQISDPFVEDRVTVYAAQASFFVVISAVPFLSVLFAAIGIIVPTDLTLMLRSVEEFLPAELVNTIAELLTELQDVPDVSLLSISAITTLWSASRGISSIRTGLQTVYCVVRRNGFFRNRLYSLCYTLSFIIMILAAAVLLLFGDFLYGILTENFHVSSHLLDGLFRFRAPIFLLFIALTFNTMYYAVARRSPTYRQTFFRHLPGALLASGGWMGFSELYALYIAYFSKMSSLYGGLTAICLIMLWLYFCMMILLGGAEINKRIFLAKRAQKQQDIV